MLTCRFQVQPMHHLVNKYPRGTLYFRPFLFICIFPVALETSFEIVAKCNGTEKHAFWSSTIGNRCCCMWSANSAPVIFVNYPIILVSAFVFCVFPYTFNTCFYRRNCNLLILCSCCYLILRTVVLDCLICWGLRENF